MEDAGQGNLIVFDKVDFLMPIARTVNAGQDDLAVFDKVEFLMLIATTVLVAGKKKQKNPKKLKLTLQIALVGGAYSVKVWMKDQDATFH